MMSDVISKRIKQLEQQNLKFKKLLESTLQITSEQTAKDLQIKTETEFLKNAVEELDEEKRQLENELRLYQSQILEQEDCPKLTILQDDHVDIQSKLLSSLNDIQRESNEILKLKTEDEQLKQIIAKLEKEKVKLLEEIIQVKQANEENNRLACENLKLRQELARLEQETSGKNISYKNCSGQDLVSRLASVENLKKNLQNKLEASTGGSLDPLNISTENTVLELQISGLEKQKQKLLNELRTSLLRSANEISQLHSDTSDGQLRNLLNELDIHKAVLMINLSNIKEMNSFEKQEKCEEKSKEKCTEDKTEKQIDNLESDNQNLVEYCHLTNPVDDTNLKEKSQKMGVCPYIKTDLVNSINQQINIKEFLGSKEQAETPSNASNPTSKSNSEHLSLSSFRSNSSEIIQEVIEIKDDKISDDNMELSSDEDEFSAFGQDIHDLPTVSEEDEPQNDLIAEHIRLKDAVCRLERERLLLLEQLENMNTAHSGGNGPHETFMREESSENFRRLPLDDATNQMYANEEQLLEQRIRELEEDNERIRRDLSSLLEEAQSDNEDLVILETGERLIRENRGNLGDNRES